MGAGKSIVPGSIQKECNRPFYHSPGDPDTSDLEYCGWLGEYSRDSDNEPESLTHIHINLNYWNRDNIAHINQKMNDAYTPAPDSCSPNYIQFHSPKLWMKTHDVLKPYRRWQGHYERGRVEKRSLKKPFVVYGNQSAIELCESPNSYGPHFYSLSEEMICNMETKTLSKYPCTGSKLTKRSDESFCFLDIELTALSEWDGQRVE